MTKGLILMTRLVDSLNELGDKVPKVYKSSVKDATRQALDALQVGISALHETNQKRRDLIRQELHSNYKSLCNAPELEETTLFGVSLLEKVKECKAGKNVGQ